MSSGEGEHRGTAAAASPARSGADDAELIPTKSKLPPGSQDGGTDSSRAAMKSPMRSPGGKVKRGRKNSVTYAVEDDDFADIAESDITSPSRLRIEDGDVDDATVAELETAADEDARLEEYFMMLTYYIASEPTGELSSDQADELLEHFYSLEPEFHKSFLDIYAADAVFTIMQRATGITETQLMGCYAIRTLLTTQLGEEDLLKKGLATELLQCYENHSETEHAELHYMLLIVMCEVAASSSAGQLALTEGGATKVIARILEKLDTSHMDALKWGCACVAFLLEDNEEGQQSFLAEGIISLLMRFITLKDKGTEDGALCSLACLALKNLLQLPEARAAYLDLEKNKTGFLPGTNVKALIDRLNAHVEIFEVQKHGVDIILVLVEGSSAETRTDELATLRGSGAHDLLTAAAAAHPNASELVAQCERGLAALSDGMVGYVYHSLIASVSSLRLWGGDTEEQVPDAKA